MVVVEYLYSDMKRIIDLPVEKIIDGLTNLGAPSEYEKETRKIITELTPNRSDWYSVEGLARSLNSYYFGKVATYKMKESDYRVVVGKGVKRIRPFTVCAVVKGLKFDDQRIRDIVLLQEKLCSTLGRKVKKFGIGFYPLQTIEFPLRYTIMKPEEIKYIPLGSDREMTADEILKEHKKGQEYGHIIEREKNYPVFVDNKNKLMCLIPIVNSAEIGKIDEKIEEVFIEVTGIELNVCKAALNIIVCTLADMGGEIFEVSVDYGGKIVKTPALQKKKMKINLKKMNKILGVKFAEAEVKKYLIKMGYEYEKGVVLVPPFRADVLGEMDILEDIAIAYGYNNFEPTLPDFFSIGKVNRAFEKIHNILLGMGFLEMKTFVLTNKKMIDDLNYVGKILEITNPSTEDFTIVRVNLVSSILEVVVINKVSGLPQKFYEVGVVWKENKECLRLVFGCVDKKIEFSEFKGFLQTFGREVGVDFNVVKNRDESMSIFEVERLGMVVVGGVGEGVGVLGKVKEEILKKMKLECEVYVCQLNLDVGKLGISESSGGG